MNKIDLYIEQFSKYIFVKNKNEVIAELKDQILNDVEVNDGDVDYVLNTLGDPEKLAINYISEGQYLIGPNYYGKFIYALLKTYFVSYIVYAVVFSIYIIYALSFEIYTNNFVLIAQFLGGAFTIFIYSTITVVIIFIIIEKSHADLSQTEIKWTTASLNVKAKQNTKLNYFLSVISLLIMLIIFLIVANIEVNIDGIDYFIINQSSINLVIVGIIYAIVELSFNLYYKHENTFKFIISILFNLGSIVICYFLFVSNNLIIILEQYPDTKDYNINSIIFYIIALSIIFNVIYKLFTYIFKR